MDGKRLIEKLTIQNFLSYGPDAEEITLEPLNVLIGANASGKSNLIEAISLLRALPSDLSAPIREGGGISEWLWKGAQTPPTATIALTMYNPNPYPRNHGDIPLHYQISFTMTSQRLEITDEVIQNDIRTDLRRDKPIFFYKYQGGHPVLSIRPPKDTTTVGEEDISFSEERILRRIPRGDLNLDQSILAQRKDPGQYPELTYIGQQLSQLHLYREWNLGRYTPPRMPQKPDLPADFLSENANNLALVLGSFEKKPRIKDLIKEKLRKFYAEAENFAAVVDGGLVQLFIHERGLKDAIPATRLSDGTLRYLCLLAILCHDKPPPLICIEEPELGLHPDIIPTIADLLKDAAQRTQLIVTTHSDVLISALSDTPEAVIVCEKDKTGSHLKRLDADVLKEWLEKYTLGELWQMGEIGGTKW